jgi:hypothetical protein
MAVGPGLTRRADLRGAFTVRQRIEGQAAGVVGRESERAVLCQLLSADRPLVVFIHGIAGVGKSALIEAFSVEARTSGAIVLRLDCGEIEPTERGFLAALSGAIGGETQSLDDATARLASLGDRVLLLFDNYEVFRPLDPWLRRAFVPALNDRVRIIFAGREPPMTGWPSRLGTLFRSLPLANLPRDDALRCSNRRGSLGPMPIGSTGSPEVTAGAGVGGGSVVGIPGRRPRGFTENAMVEAPTCSIAR